MRDSALLAPWLIIAALVVAASLPLTAPAADRLVFDEYFNGTT